MSAQEVKVPDIGDFEDVPVIEILVGPGDAIGADQPLVTLESDKATMDVPSPFAGKVVELKVARGRQGFRGDDAHDRRRGRARRRLDPASSPASAALAAEEQDDSAELPRGSGPEGQSTSEARATSGLTPLSAREGA